MRPAKQEARRLQLGLQQEVKTRVKKQQASKQQEGIITIRKENKDRPKDRQLDEKIPYVVDEIISNRQF